jgi:signal peptidase I
MIPTLLVGDFILVNKFTYGIRLPVINKKIISINEPQRGDVMVFRYPEDPSLDYIKRVIGLPGDTLQFKDGEVYVTPAGTDKPAKLSEGYLSAFNKGRTFLPNDVRENSFTVPADEYFVMGDNRNNSSDSRSCFRTCMGGDLGHFLKRSDVIGKVFLDLGYFKVFNDFSLVPLRIQLAQKPEWILKPRFLDTPRTWNYPELSNR